MTPKKSILLWLTVCGIGCLLPAVWACSCAPQHPQDHYCNADFAIIARILRKSVQSNSYRHIYKIEIKKTYKMSDQAREYLKEGRITTAAYDSMCGVNFKEGQLYVIAGQSNNISLCDYVKEYKKMTIIERRGFGSGYKRGCHRCKIVTTFSGQLRRKSASSNSCIYRLVGEKSRCYSDLTMCLPVPTPTNAGGAYHRDTICQWRKNPYFLECENEP